MFAVSPIICAVSKARSKSLEKTASEHIACADKNNDKSVDLLEFFRNDLITYYLVYENLELDQAIGKADKKLEELNIKTSEDLRNYAKKIKEQKQSAGEFAYVFDTIYKLCKVLELKQRLGVDLRKAYKDKNVYYLKLLTNKIDDVYDIMYSLE